MRIAVTYGPMCLQRTAEETWNDPRTGSEIGWRRIANELEALGHIVTTYDGRRDPAEAHRPEVVVSINEPVRLREFTDAKLRVCMFWLNEFNFCKEGKFGHEDYDTHVDLYCSPSEAHRQKAIGDWGAPAPEKWLVNRLGCDAVDHSAAGSKVPGRVVYCSSPDRGLHRVLEAWPSIKRRAPQVTLRIFYRLEPFLRGFDATPYHPPIERNRARALYIEEALKRMRGPEWGIEVVDSVSHEQVLSEMAQAELLLHPCETLSWSEGFSVTCLDACSRACVPIVTDCDALGEIYKTLDPIPLGDWAGWRDRVVLALTDASFRREMSGRALSLAEGLSWKRHVKQLETDILSRV